MDADLERMRVVARPDAWVGEKMFWFKVRVE